MDALKVCGGVAAGVGTIALLPVAGPIGTISLLGVVLGGATGGILGAAVSEVNDDELLERYNEGLRFGKSSNKTPKVDSSKVWPQACAYLKEVLDEKDYRRITSQIECRNRLGGIDLMVASVFFKEWLKENQLPIIRKALKAANDGMPISVSVVVKYTENKTVWPKACAYLKEILDEKDYEWMVEKTQCRNGEVDKLELVVENTFFKEWMEERHFPMIQKAVTAANDGKKLTVSVVVDLEETESEE